MTTIFVGGSRSISRLNPTLRAKLDEFVEKGCSFLIGDAHGSDKAVQQYLKAREWPHVVVYCMDQCRNNVGAWPVKQILHGGAARSFAYFAQKDQAMAEDAGCGFMLWDGRSKGTLNNLQNLLAAGKKTLVYFSPENAFHKVARQEDLAALLQKCDATLVDLALRRIHELPKQRPEAHAEAQRIAERSQL